MSKRDLYFVKQKLMGLLLLVLTVLTAIFAVETAMISVITVPLGLTLMTSNRRYLVNDYFFEEGKEEKKGL